MVRSGTLARKISYVLEKSRRLKSIQDASKEDFLGNQDLQDIVLHNLQLAIQACIDMGTHIITDQGWGTPGSLSEVFYKLEDRGVIDRPLSDLLVQMVGFRNRVIHDYEDVDLNIVYEIWQDGLKDIEKYIQRIGDYFKV
jgi:uncharacterized protein YutE (UPF0331/DUF86 family)